MALALLCSQLKDIKPSTLFNHDVHEDLQQLQQCDFKAFIVNHGAREGSLDEAHAVAEVLHKRSTSFNLDQRPPCKKCNTNMTFRHLNRSAINQLAL